LLEKHDNDRRGSRQASFAGMAVNVRPPIYSSEGEPKLRIVETVLKRAPSVVSAQPRGLDDAIIDTNVVDVANLHMTRANPYPPGSRTYIAHAQTIAPPKWKRGLTTPKSKAQRQADSESNEVSKDLLSTLQSIIRQFPPKNDQNAAS
jgi:hypothetical protein